MQNPKQVLKALLILLTILSPTLSHKHHCKFDSLYPKQNPPPHPNDKPDQLQQQHVHFRHGRNLQALVRNPIHISLDMNDLNTVKSTVHGQPQTSTVNLSFIKKAMTVVQNFLQARIKVSTVSRVFAPALCVDFSPSPNDVSNGISPSDLHIYVRYITDSSSSLGYSATGKSCKYITGRNLPDPTFQQGRPTVGRIIFNTYNIIDRQTSLTNRLFAEVTTTALHQTLHIIGFDSTLYSTYLNPSTGALYTPAPIYQSVSLDAGRTGGNNYILKTPSVVAWAKDFFACASITGMPLENEETPAGIGSHWERLAMYDEIMTGTQLGAQKGVSGLTFALLKDMGWYEVDGSFNDTSNYGYNKGCNFFNKACYDTVTQYPEYFCDMTSYAGVSACASNFLGKAVCTNVGTMSDGCPIFGGYFHCVDPAQSDDGYKAYTLQKYRTDSFCVQSTFANVGISNKYRGRCYPYKCQASSIEFYIDVYTIICQSNEEGVQKVLTSLNGYLKCPNFVSFCQQTRKICPNWCSQNGYCTRGICNCLPGYYGPDCSITSCITGNVYDTSTSTCVASCPSRYYLNKYSVSCLPCSSSCSQCRDQPTICTGCQSTSTNRQYFLISNSSCVSACPGQTYTDGDYCRDCDATTAFCAKCEYLSSNCTACVGGKFLQNPLFGTCGPTCSGTYSIYDVQNFKCVSGCTDNLIYYSGGCLACPAATDGNCNLCASGTYKYIGDQSCHAVCPSKYYANEARRFCQSCHSSCKECNGGYPENCTQCLSSSNFKYLLLSKICVAKCPLGFFPNDNTTTCQVCPPNKNCATCTVLGSGVVACLTCKYGFYLQPSKTCLTTCDPTYFKNIWNHTCDACSNACGNCTTGADGSCTDCRSGKLFLANITGKYCVSGCPNLYYYTFGTTCLDCYSTCKTCNGVNSDNCLTCINGLFLSQGKCRYVCPVGTYPRSTTGVCETCNTNCKFCFGPTVDNCTACVAGLVLNNFTCAGSCPQGLTVNQWGVCFEEAVFWGLLWVLGVLAMW